MPLFNMLQLEYYVGFLYVKNLKIITWNLEFITSAYNKDFVVVVKTKFSVTTTRTSVLTMILHIIFKLFIRFKA